jgi:hypothetical protein
MVMGRVRRFASNIVNRITGNNRPQPTQQRGSSTSARPPLPAVMTGPTTRAQREQQRLDDLTRAYIHPGTPGSTERQIYNNYRTEYGATTAPALTEVYAPPAMRQALQSTGNTINPEGTVSLVGKGTGTLGGQTVQLFESVGGGVSYAQLPDGSLRMRRDGSSNYHLPMSLGVANALQASGFRLQDVQHVGSKTVLSGETVQIAKLANSSELALDINNSPLFFKPTPDGQFINIRAVLQKANLPVDAQVTLRRGKLKTDGEGGAGITVVLKDGSVHDLWVSQDNKQIQRADELGYFLPLETLNKLQQQEVLLRKESLSEDPTDPIEEAEGYLRLGQGQIGNCYLLARLEGMAEMAINQGNTEALQTLSES